MITEEGSPKDEDGKLEFKLEEDSKSDSGSKEGIETIEYIKIGEASNSNTLLKDDWNQSSGMKFGQSSSEV
jgi:hypothetical protein